MGAKISTQLQISSPHVIHVPVSAGMSNYEAGVDMYPKHRALVQTYMAELELNSDIRNAYRRYDEIHKEHTAVRETYQLASKTRRQIIYEQVRLDIINKGFKQVVLFADGVNPMVMALASEFPNVTFYCTDVNYNLIEKRRDMFEKFHLRNITCCYINSEHTDTFLDELEDYGLDRSEKTLATMENILIYLKNAEEFMTKYLDAHEDNEVIANTCNAQAYVTGEGMRDIIDWHLDSLCKHTEMKVRHAFLDINDIALTHHYQQETLLRVDQNPEFIFRLKQQ